MLMAKWAVFCQECAAGTHVRQQIVKASKVSFKDAKEQSIGLEDPGDPSFEDIERMIYARVQFVERQFEQEWGNSIPAKL